MQEFKEKYLVINRHKNFGLREDDTLNYTNSGDTYGGWHDKFLIFNPLGEKVVMGLPLLDRFHIALLLESNYIEKIK